MERSLRLLPADTKLLPATQSYFPWHKVTSFYVLLFVEESDFMSQEVVAELMTFDA
jgi:hypothetical protein